MNNYTKLLGNKIVTSRQQASYRTTKLSAPSLFIPFHSQNISQKAELLLSFCVMFFSRYFCVISAQVFASYLSFCGIGMHNTQRYEQMMLQNRRNQVSRSRFHTLSRHHRYCMLMSLFVGHLVTRTFEERSIKNR